MKRGALVVQHDVVRPRHAHDEVAASHAEQSQEHVHVVLISLGMVGVANVAAHRQAQQLAAKMVFESGTDDLFAVVQILGADEADDAVDQQRIEGPRYCIGARLAGLLIDAVVCIGGQGTALPGFKIHHVLADRAARQRQCRSLGFG